MHAEVLQFHTAFGLPHPAVMTRPDPALRRLRVSLLREEAQELADATSANDIVEIADALADMAYIACGTAISYGLAGGLASETQVIAMVRSITGAPRVGSIDERQAFDEAMTRVLANYCFAEEAAERGETDEAPVLHRLSEVLLEVGMHAHFHNVPLERVFLEVHRANMSKLGEDGKPIYREDGKVMKGPNYRRPDVKSVLIGVS